MGMEAVPLHLREANSFVAPHRRHNLPTVGSKFAVGAAQGGKLIGLATGRRHLEAEGVERAGPPTARRFTGRTG
jgi:hypothetical protein